MNVHEKNHNNVNYVRTEMVAHGNTKSCGESHKNVSFASQSNCPL